MRNKSSLDEATRPEPEPEIAPLTPPSPGTGMTIKVAVDAIKHEVGLQGTMSPKEVIAAAVEHYGVEAGERSLKHQVKKVAVELNIDTDNASRSAGVVEDNEDVVDVALP